MKLVKMEILGGRACLLNMDAVAAMRFYQEDKDGDCKMAINGIEIGYVHGENTAKNIMKTLCEEFDGIELDRYGNIVTKEKELWN